MSLLKTIFQKDAEDSHYFEVKLIPLEGKGSKKKFLVRKLCKEIKNPSQLAVLRLGTNAKELDSPTNQRVWKSYYFQLMKNSVLRQESPPESWEEKIKTQNTVPWTILLPSSFCVHTHAHIDSVPPATRQTESHLNWVSLCPAARNRHTAL